MLTLLFFALAQEVVVTGTYAPIPLEEADRNVRVLASKRIEQLDIAGCVAEAVA